MSLDAIPASTDQPARLPRHRLTLVWINTIGATCVLATELLAVFASLDWALSGLFGLSPVVTLSLAAILLAMCGAIIWVFARQALRAEMELALRGAPPAPQTS